MSIRKTPAELPPAMWLPLRRLYVDEHQGRRHARTIRNLQERWAGHVVGNKLTLPGIFDVAADKGTTVERGNFSIHDGRHRHEVASEKYEQDTLVLCKVDWHPTDAGKDATYLDVNFTHNRHPGDRYQRAVGAGAVRSDYAKFTAIDQTIMSLGLRVDTDNTRDGLGVLRCPKSLERVYDLGEEDRSDYGPGSGAALLGQVLTIIATTWPTDEMRFDGRIVEGLGIFLQEVWPDEVKLTRKIGKRTPAHYIARARDFQALKVRSPEFGQTVPALVAHLINEQYTSGR